jgi:hypothetical protein
MGAEALIDGQLVGILPLDLELPHAAQPRTLTIQRAGYAPWSRVVAGDTDVTLTVHLARRRSAPARASKPAPAPKPAASTRAATPPLVDPFSR